MRNWAILILVAVAVAGLGCGEGDEGDNLGGAAEAVGPIHVHGLGVNPKDGALLIATHTGLFRSVADKARSERVADRYQDTMGFTVVGADHFLGSGHPDLREKLPPLLGLIESKDGGESWKPVSLLGEADFHVLEAAGEHVYGFDASGGRLLVSRNAGGRWGERRTPGPLVSLAIDPRDAAHVVASSGRALYESRDEGRRWNRISADAGLLGWPDRGHMYLVRADGSVLQGRDGRHWKPAGEVGGQPAAFEAEAQELYAALHDGTVKRSTDGGRSWTVRSQP